MLIVLNFLGELGYLLLQTLVSLKYWVADRHRIFIQIEKIGIDAIPLVLLIGLFAGSIITWQGAYQMQNIATFSLLGGQAAKVIAMEMAPVLTGLMICGRVGTSMTAEIGAMKVAEQIDALRTMSINPIRYIVMPRFFALVCMMPILTLFSIITALFGAYLIATLFLNLTTVSFFHSVRQYFELQDLIGGLVKSFVFGVIIACLGCYLGLTTKGGSQGIGKSTIQSFVYSAISVLASDFLLWIVLF